MKKIKNIWKMKISNFISTIKINQINMTKKSNQSKKDRNKTLRLLKF